MQIREYLGMDESGAIARVVARTRAYCEIESPSHDAAALLRLAALVRADLEAGGAAVETVEVPEYGANLIARVPGSDASLEPVLVLAHMDTVHPVGSLAERPFRIEDGRAYAPGIYDMKTGLALAVEALAWLRGRGVVPRRPVTLLVTCDEEVGSYSARAPIEAAARTAAAVLVPEPCLPDGGVKTFRKGVATYRIDTTGRAAHAGIEGAAAVSAITELVTALTDVLRLADHERGTTFNIGRISGGTASNVVAAAASAVIDVRLAEPAEGERVHEAMLALRPQRPDAGLDVVLAEDRPPLLRTDAVAALYERARELAAGLGVALTEGATGGGSDGSFAGAVGAAVLDGLGARGGGAHAVDEHIVLADLPFRLALMARLFETL